MDDKRTLSYMSNVAAKYKVPRISARNAALKRSLPASCWLHTSPELQDANKTTIVQCSRTTYLRTYPLLLVHPDGSTITIHYKEPRKLLTLPIDITTLTEEERKVRQRLRDQSKKGKVKEEKDIYPDISLDEYKKFWKKK
ncbi:PREDICTED: 39S ribosomal protein L55, mitochondrial [Nanorana parkeri]|uniref:39S ribosomal protein L55, mitochondrial n=1 Tax=Nanorana parkeri TaxID=125878 RepID=UPI0008544E19|nr:PREDICTED: 39S ribosomal protein L55, mitochondrial [Nanorana parkeri]